VFLAPRSRTSPRCVSAESLRCGTYLTDGRRLFRVVSQFAPAGDDVFASLEDCRTLDVQAYAPGELQAMKLKPIRR
jgi:hypothetical protein